MSLTTSPPPTPSLARPTNLRYFVLAALLVITTINYVQRNCIAPAATTMADTQSLNLRIEAVGQDLNEEDRTKEEKKRKKVRLDDAMAAFFWSYTFFMVPSSWLSQRWGPRLALTLFAGGWSLVTLACAFVVGFIDLYAARLLLGILQAGIFPCATLILAVWYPRTQRGLATALLNSFMLIGSAVSSMLTGWLLGPMGRLFEGFGLAREDGWRGVFALFALPGLAWAVWFYWWFRNRPEDHAGVNAAELALLRPAEPEAKPSGKASPVPWLLILTSVPLLLLFTQQAFRAGANRLFDSRFPTYCEERLLDATKKEKQQKQESETITQDERDLAKAGAGTLASLPLFAGVIGGVVGGALSDWVLRRTNSRRLGRCGVALFSLLSCVAIYALAYPIENVWVAASVLSLGFLVFCFSSPCAYSLTIDVGGKHLAVIFGLMNMIGNLGAALFVSSVSRLEGLGGWNLVFGVWIAMHLIAAACWVFLSPDVKIGEPDAAPEAADGALAGARGHDGTGIKTAGGGVIAASDVTGVRTDKPSV